MSDYMTNYFKMKIPKSSGWKCYLFGGKYNGIVWRPVEGEVPNWFWRKMQYLCFGNEWVKDEKGK